MTKNLKSKPFLTLEEFTKFLEIIKKHDEKESRLSKSLEDLVDGWPIIIFGSDIVASLIRLLEKCMGDKFETITYWIYEIEWGKKAKEFYIEHPDGTQYHLYTIKDLYNYLINHNE